MHEYGIPCIAPNSENTPISDKTLEKLKSKYDKIVYFFDNDEPGLAALSKVKEKHPDIICYHIDPKLEVKDVSDLRKKYGKKATDKFIEEFKQYVNDQTNEETTENDWKTE